MKRKKNLNEKKAFIFFLNLIPRKMTGTSCRIWEGDCDYLRKEKLQKRLKLRKGNFENNIGKSHRHGQDRGWGKVWFCLVRLSLK